MVRCMGAFHLFGVFPVLAGNFGRRDGAVYNTFPTAVNVRYECMNERKGRKEGWHDEGNNELIAECLNA